MMTLESLAAEINASTGLTGLELTSATCVAAMLLAEVVGDQAAAEHFRGRVIEIEQQVR